MVVKVNLNGGLGNQLFIQVAGMWLARKTDSALESYFVDGSDEFTAHGNRITVRQPWHESAHRSVLGILRSQVLKREELMRFIWPRASRVVQSALREFVAVGPGYDPEIDHASGDTCLHGYFQTWKLAHEFEKEEILELLLTQNQSAAFSDLAQEAELTSPAVVHIRRGDYKKLSKDFGLLSKNYYQEAFKILEIFHGTEKPIWIFSDEPIAVRSDFKDFIPRNAIWISGNHSLTAAEELRLMAHGSAHIISNSTFAWWGAWLSQGSMVIAPEKWFRGREDPRDLYPSTWISLSSQWDDLFDGESS